MKKIKTFLLLTVSTILVLPHKLFAEEFVTQPLYGVEPYPMPVLYGPGIPDPTNLVWWSLERIFAFIVLPVAIIVTLIIGVVIYIKRKKRTKDV